MLVGFQLACCAAACLSKTVFRPNHIGFLPAPNTWRLAGGESGAIWHQTAGVVRGMLALAPLPRVGSSTGRASAQGAPVLAMPPDPPEAAAAAATFGQDEAAAPAPAPVARVDDNSSPFGAAGRGLCAGHSTGTGHLVILFDLRHQQRPRARRRAVAAAQVRA